MSDEPAEIPLTSSLIATTSLMTLTSENDPCKPASTAFPNCVRGPEQPSATILDRPALYFSTAVNTGDQSQLQSAQKDTRFRSGETYYTKSKRARLDYLCFGEWQQQYGRWFIESMALNGKRVLDLGCACGAVMRALGQAGAIVQGVDINEHMIQLGRNRWPDMAKLMLVCDAVNLHPFASASWDAVHAAQIAHEWKSDLVPTIFRELQRVVRPGGLLFCSMNVEEPHLRESRNQSHEFENRARNQPMDWWHEQLQQCGWELCSTHFETAMREHPEDFLQRYDWNWFVARRPGAPRIEVETTTFFSPPLLTIITRRHPDRSTCFETLLASIRSQTNTRIQHILLRDLEGIGVSGANRLLADEIAIRDVEGEYVQVIDDDDVIVSTEYVERLQECIRLHDSPPWIMVKGDVSGHGIYPRPWGNAWSPTSCSAASFSIVVRSDVWTRYHKAWDVSGQGDTIFARTLWNAGLRPVWFDFLACRTQRVSRGRAE